MTKDPVSGINVMLPGKPTLTDTTVTDADGVKIPLRQYLVEFNGGDRAVLFQVADAAFRSFDADIALKKLASPDGKVTTSRRLAVDGHPATDARVTATIESTPAVYLVRIVLNKGYVVGIFTIGRLTEESELTSLHRQVIETLHLI